MTGVSIAPSAAAAAVSALASLLALAAGVLALRRRHLVPAATGVLLGLLLLALAAFFATLGVAVQGYRALTREEVALTLWTRPAGAQRFEVDVLFADGSSRSFALTGDQFYVDARILKWHPWANLLGLHTAYELDRIAGRYARLEDERDKPRTLFALGRARPVDAFELRRRFAWLAPLLDAEYGSATFASANRPARYEVRVSTTGLLVREIDATAPWAAP
ncbi:MAG TPA: hypothetical protein VIY27_04255 [Myxococcota bacterium]